MSKVNIGIDIRGLQSRGGIPEYLNALLSFLKNNSYHNYYFFSDSKIRSKRKKIIYVPNIIPSKFNNLKRFFWENIILPLYTNRYNIDVFHSPSWNSIKLKNYKLISHVHDLSFLRYPNELSNYNFLYFKHLVLPSYKDSEHIITDSNSTKEDIVKFLSIPENKITKSYLGVIHHKFSNPRRPKLLCDENFEEYKSFLFVGSIVPRKNLPRLLDAFALLKSHRHKIQLIIVGTSLWGSKAVRDKVKKHNLENDVKFLGPIDNQELAWLYLNSHALVFPSLWEGFGFPLIEAMVSNLPIITSNNSSMSEIVKDSAILVDPSSSISISEGLKSSFDERLCKKLVIKGRNYVKEYNWKTHFKELVSIYHRISKFRKVKA